VDESNVPAHTNRLIGETSPYLLQHAHNPVDWYPWGEEALTRAREEDRLILLSIGYAACHWCHVMERESFEDADIATQMNGYFVNIKVDREERPDLDEIYMAATVAMNQGQGGWPMTVFLTPDLEPVFAGTYFPPVDGYGRPGFGTVLKAVAGAWREDRANVLDHANRITDHLRQQQASFGPPMTVGEDELLAAVGQYRESFDAAYGGFGPAPKFPPATGLSLLLRLHHSTRDSGILEMVCKTLDAMALGGIYDHLAGGFARYSTDRRWLVPHFEKMLYDNALLASVFLEGYQSTGDDLYRRVAAETLDYVQREMTAPEGGFFSSTDADSEGEEGRFFVWTPEEVASVLGPDRARTFGACYDVTAAGNWEGRSVLNVPEPLERVAGQLNLAPDVLRQELEACRRDLYNARLERVPPATDDKILAGWNGLMISAFAAGFRVLGERGYLVAARNAADFVLQNFVRDDGSLLRSHRIGKTHLNGCLEDYAYLAEGLVDLFEVSGDTRYLGTAEQLGERILTDFLDDQTGAFFSTPGHHERLLVRYRDGADGATPSPNASAALALARLSYHLDDEQMRASATRSIEAYGTTIARFPRAFAKSLVVVDFLAQGPIEIALVGDEDHAGTQLMRRELARHYLPRRIEVMGGSDSRSSSHPLLRGKTAIEGRATLYVCRDYACRAPLTDPAMVAATLTAETGVVGA
jgi:uncharacterized protein YyaL (SSP411 family)